MKAGICRRQAGSMRGGQAGSRKCGEAAAMSGKHRMGMSSSNARQPREQGSRASRSMRVQGGGGAALNGEHFRGIQWQLYKLPQGEVEHSVSKKSMRAGGCSSHCVPTVVVLSGCTWAPVRILRCDTGKDS